MAVVGPRGHASRTLFAAGAIVLGSSCHENKVARPPPPSLAETGTVVARVDGTPITGEAVLAIARAKHVSLKEARDLAIRDALFAKEAIAKNLDIGVTRDLDVALAQGLVRTFRTDAMAQGPISDDEVVPFAVKNFFFVARPESWATIHALVPLKTDASQADIDRAHSVAVAIRDVERPIGASIKGTFPMSNVDAITAAFDDAANSVDKQGYKLEIEPLPPIAKDGATVFLDHRDPLQGPFDPEFVKGATALAERGDISDPVRSQFGWHVILLLDRVPEQMVKLDPLKVMFADDVYDARAKNARVAFVDGLRKTTPPEIPQNVDATLALLRIGKSSQAKLGAP
jgi:peptidyl-prolyl cis-trans isomerase C